MGGQGKMINRKRKFVGRKTDDPEFDLDKKHFKVLHVNASEKRLIIVLEGAQLETVKVHGTFELLNCDDHAGIMRKNQRDPGSCRPDITHQCLLMLFDSPLNRAGLLQVFVRTEHNVLIEINPQTRIPRTFKRFAGLMVQLLHKFQIRANDSSRRLMSVIKNPITDHLPVGCKKYAMSFSGKLVANCRDLVPHGEEGSVAYDEPVVMVIGAFAHGVLKTDYTEELFSISNYPLSAAIACSKLCSAFEEVWKVV
ncbi:GL13401 [Drosophila persimilis]|uniref:18S rRNA (pseudouridine-N1)-methyltransferase n=2 Tax=pseudoobscura subgroup TaxID=32358 RepID=Q29JM3_DROPS|nr:ribosomal RNA small subunit methyltransferase NEP1 [Drosophila pseudoobscura]XP_002025281.1 ribosomal RNA small subunit methyltransferase NEP1 [Drosophila persimilis]XP_017141375.1 ribosomal RNA small subunit methyltransferase NEP1 [Drosophila miranda]EDW30780.1 GL13401 [Drosophila persimilis]